MDRVFVSQSSESLAAVNAEQFYVSVSRAREMAKIFTDDKQALEQAVLKTGRRMTAREVAYRHDRQKVETIRHKQSKPLNNQKAQSHGTGYSI